MLATNSLDERSTQTNKGSSMLPASQLDTDEAYEAAKREVIWASRATALLWLGYWMFACIAIFALPFYIAQESLPPVIRPIWNPQALVLVLMIPFILLLRFSPFGRRAVANIPLANAVLTFERAIKEYAKWQQKRNPVNLKRSYKYILGAQERLEGVPKFSKWKSTIVKDYEQDVRGIE